MLRKSKSVLRYSCIAKGIAWKGAIVCEVN